MTSRILHPASAECCLSPGHWTTWGRLGAIGGALLLTGLLLTGLIIGLIIGLGMALWAAEGRDVRDTLIAIGASPRTLASLAAQKTWILAGVGTFLAVPLGYGTLYAVLRSRDDETTFPWLFAVAAVVALRAVIATITWLGSTLSQCMRRGRSTSAIQD